MSGRLCLRRIYRAHAARRLRERYGAVSRRDVLRIEHLIRQGAAYLAWVQADRRQVHLLGWAGRTLILIYDPILDCLVTALPRS